MTEHQVPIVLSEKLINPDLARYLGAHPGSRAVVEIAGQRRPVVLAYYDPHTDQIVLHLADQGEGGDQ